MRSAELHWLSLMDDEMPIKLSTEPDAENNKDGGLILFNYSETNSIIGPFKMVYCLKINEKHSLIVKKYKYFWSDTNYNQVTLT